MEYFWVVMGAILGSAISSILYLMRTSYGTLKIDSSNPEKDIYRFEITDSELDKLSKKKRIVLTIEHNADLSRK